MSDSPSNWVRYVIAFSRSPTTQASVSVASASRPSPAPRACAPARAPGDGAARRAALAVGRYLSATQTAEGFWQLPNAGPYAELAERDSFEVHLDITAEFSTFLSEIAARVS